MQKRNTLLPTKGSIVTLKVTDPSGLSSTDTMTIKAGNTAPVVNISTTGNSSFYFDATSLDYAVDVKIRKTPVSIRRSCR